MQQRMLFDEPYLDPVYWTLVVEISHVLYKSAFLTHFGSLLIQT